jgi:hypothetical protein
MFGKEFYPTPAKLIRRMLEPYFVAGTSYLKLSGKSILDPEAGKADILDFIKEHSRGNPEMFAIEIEPDLQSILHSKKYDVIGDDFLQYDGDIFFDLIVMNPPFSNGDQHLLKAWDILKDGEIVCLLNAETILNPYSNKRKLLKRIIEEHGSFEIVEDGFVDAERKTLIKTAIVRLKKEDKSFDDILNFEGFNESVDDFDFENSYQKNEIAVNDVFQTYVDQYGTCKELFKNFLKAYHQLNNAILLFQGGERSYSGLDFCKIADNKEPKKAYNKFDKQLKAIGWSAIFSKTKVSGMVSSKVVENFGVFQQQRKSLSFDKPNILNLLSMLYLNKEVLIEQSISDVFEMMCSYDKKNKIHYEGWKTNDSYKINRKVIVPFLVKYGQYSSAYDLKSYGDRFSIYHSNKLHDIDLVLCLITGKKINEITTIQKALEMHFKELGNLKTGDSFSNKVTSTFFEVKFFKKGTTHLYFKDPFVHSQLNIRYAKGKNWLPDDYKAKEKREKAKSKAQEKKNNPEPKKTKPKAQKRFTGRMKNVRPELLELFKI